MTIRDELVLTQNTKDRIKEAMRNKGISISDDTPFWDYPSLLGRIDSKVISELALYVYFSWIDPDSGDPVYRRVTCYQGDTVNFPEGFPTIGDTIEPIEKHSPKLEYIYTSGKVDQLVSGVQEDLIIQAEYRLASSNTFYLRFKNTESFPKAVFKASFRVDSPGMCRVAIDGQFKENFGAPINVDPVPLVIELEESPESEHLLEIAFTNGARLKSFYLGSDGYDNNGRFEGCSCYQDGGPGGQPEHMYTDQFYASQVQAIYFPRFNAGQSLDCNILSFGTNNLANLTTVVLSVDNTVGSDEYLGMLLSPDSCFRKTISLKYISEINDRSSPIFGTKKNPQYMFAYTNIPFLQIKKLYSLGEGFLYMAKEIELLPAEIKLGYIGNNNCFYNCISLRRIPQFPATADMVNHDGALFNFAVGCEMLRDVPDLYNCKVGSNVFSYCSNLGRVPNFHSEPLTYHEPKDRKLSTMVAELNRKAVRLNSTVTDVGDYFFFGSKELSSWAMSFHDVTSIGSHFMGECINLEAITNLPTGLTYIGDYFLQGCIQFTTIGEFPITLREIGTYFLNGCASIEEVPTLPANIIIGDYFLCDCLNLRRINLNKTFATAMPPHALMNCPSIETIYIPDGEMNAYRQRFPDIPFNVWSEEKGEWHNVLFSWLQTNPDYSPRSDLTPLRHKRVWKRVFHGDPCPIPEDFGPAKIRTESFHPGLLSLCTSGETIQLITGVTHDIIAQAEYTMCLDTEYDFRMKETYNLTWIFTIISLIQSARKPYDFITKFLNDVPQMIDQVHRVLGPSSGDPTYMSPGAEIPAGLYNASTPNIFNCLVRPLDYQPGSSYIRESQIYWRGTLTHGSPLIMTIGTTKKRLKYFLDWVFHFNLGVGDLPVDGYTYLTHYETGARGDKASEEAAVFIEWVPPGHSAWTDPNMTDINELILYKLKFADQIKLSRRAFVDNYNDYSMFYLPAHTLKNIYGGSTNTTYTVRLRDDTFEYGNRIIGVSPCSIVVGGRHEPASIALGAPKDGYVHNWFVPSDGIGNYMLWGRRLDTGEDNFVADHVRELYIGDSCICAREKSIAYMDRLNTIIISNLRNTSNNTFKFYGNNLCYLKSLTYISAFNDYLADDVKVPGENEGLVGRVAMGLMGEQGVEDVPFGLLTHCDSLNYIPNMCIQRVPSLMGAWSPINIVGSIQAEFIGSSFLSHCEYILYLDSIVPPNQCAKFRLCGIEHAFLEYCKNLRRVVIPELTPLDPNPPWLPYVRPVTQPYVEDYFLCGCQSLETVDISYMPISIWNDEERPNNASTAFLLCSALQKIYVPLADVQAYRDLFTHISPSIFEGVQHE